MKTLEERLAEEVALLKRQVASLDTRLEMLEPQPESWSKPEYVWVAVIKGFDRNRGVTITQIGRELLSDDVDLSGDYTVQGRDAQVGLKTTYINKFFVDTCPETLKARLHEMVDAAFEEAVSDE